MSQVIAVSSSFIDIFKTSHYFLDFLPECNSTLCYHRSYKLVITVELLLASVSLLQNPMLTETIASKFAIKEEEEARC